VVPGQAQLLGALEVPIEGLMYSEGV
jgi:hypothetical protein